MLHILEGAAADGRAFKVEGVEIFAGDAFENMRRSDYEGIIEEMEEILVGRFILDVDGVIVHLSPNAGLRFTAIVHGVHEAIIIPEHGGGINHIVRCEGLAVMPLVLRAEFDGELSHVVIADNVFREDVLHALHAIRRRRKHHERAAEHVAHVVKARGQVGVHLVFRAPAQVPNHGSIRVGLHALRRGGSHRLLIQDLRRRLCGLFSFVRGVGSRFFGAACKYCKHHQQSECQCDEFLSHCAFSFPLIFGFYLLTAVAGHKVTGRNLC